MSPSFEPNGVASPAVEDCPFCGLESAFEVLWFFGGQHYTRKCRACQKLKDFDLPALSKKVIYLDQFVLSDMMKEIDPSRAGKPARPNGAFFLELGKQLHRLTKLQLVVCPRSRIHVNESIVDHDDGDKIREVHERLSFGTKFDHHESIYA